MLNLLVMLDGEVRSRGQNLGSEVKTKGKTSRKITEKTIRKTIEKRVRMRPRGEVANINPRADWLEWKTSSKSPMYIFATGNV